MRWTRAGAGCLGAAAAAALVYGLTLAPSVGAGDGGELILAAQSFGIPHPPGYPVWVLLARFAALAPIGSLAWRVNALSALFAAIAAGLCYVLAARCGLSRGPRALATALFAGSTIVWGSAVTAEVYSLASAAFLVLALAALRARSKRTASGSADALYFFVAGISPLVHQTLLFPAALLGVWVLARGFRAARLMAALGWAMVGFSIVLVLPLRSAAHPALDWGQDRDLPSLIGNLLRLNYGSLRQNPLGLRLLVDESVGFAAILAGALGVAGVAFALLGGLLARRERPALLVLLAAALTIPAALALLVGFTPDPEHLAQVGPFLSPMLAALALWAGAGAGAAVGRAPARTRGALALVCAALALVTVGAHYGRCDRSQFTLPERYAHDLLGPLPQGATLILDGDNETFLAAYATRIEGFRSDLHLIHRRGYVFGDPYGLHGIPRARWADVAHRVDLDRLATARAPIYYATPPADLVRAGIRFVNEGLVYRAELPSAAAPHLGAASASAQAAWPKSSDLLPGGPDRYDYVTRKLAVTYSDVRAQALWEADRYQEALPWFADAAKVGFDFPAARMNLAVSAAAAGHPEITLTELLAAQALAPKDPEPSARIAVLLATAGRYRDAALYFERAYRIAPSAELAADAARAWSLAGEPALSHRWEAKG